MREVMGELRQWRAAGEAVAIGTVIETWGSSPRPPGSKMLVTGSGLMAGSVSNGCIEGEVFEQARRLIREGAPGRILSFGVADEVAFEVGLACGGHIEVLLQPAGPAHDRALELIVAETPFTLRSDLGDFGVEVVEGAPDLDQPRRRGGVFEEPFERPLHMVILGAIHIAIPLHRLARLLGYRVTVIDARARFATAERFPEADRVLVQWPDEALAALDVDPSTAVVILTHDPKFDMPALRAALPTAAGYIGAIGSRATNARRFQALRAEGFGEEQLARIHGPIGLDLGGRSAEETALGIMAEVTAVRHRARAGFMREPRPEPAG